MKLLTWLLALTVLLPASFSQAAMTAVRFYHLGEADAGGGHTVVATNSVDSVSTNSLTFTGAPRYWSHVAPANTNSILSLLFATADQGVAAVVPDTNNVCLEAWANSGFRDTHVIAYNGNPALDGYGIVLETNIYKAVLGGVATVGSVPCPPGEWMHLALVCSNGTAKFFTNGQLAASMSAVPKPPTGNLTVGGPNTGTNIVQGFVDEVRISTFAPGGFNPTDLLYVPLPPRSLAITRGVANKVVVSSPAVYSSALLQETTNLTSPNWQPIASSVVLGTQRVWTNSLQGGARFYRLTEAAKAAPVPVVIGIQPDSGGTNPVVFAGDYVFESDGRPDFTTPPISAVERNIYDASASVDPLSGTSNTLSIHWEIFKSNFQGGDQYTAQGITGYHSPVLQIVANSFPDQPPQQSDPTAAFWRVRLTLQHIPYTPNVVPSQETIVWFRFEYLLSSVTMSDSAACQSCAPLPASCPACMIDAARATTEEP